MSPSQPNDPVAARPLQSTSFAFALTVCWLAAVSVVALAGIVFWTSSLPMVQRRALAPEFSRQPLLGSHFPSPPILAAVQKVPAPRATASATAPAPQPSENQILLHTAQGDLVLTLFPDLAPRTVAQVLKLARLGAYDTTHFGRLEKGFVMQVHNAEDRLTPLTDEQRQALQPIPAEFSQRKHLRGILSLAHADGQPDSGVSSFSILLGAAPHLDGAYTVFGEVSGGMDVLDRLEKTPTSNGNRPDSRLTILSAEAPPLAKIRLPNP